MVILVSRHYDLLIPSSDFTHFPFSILALAWSPLYSSGPADTTGKGHWAWLVTLQRSGHVVLWKVSSPNGQLQLAGSYDLELTDPSSIQLASGSHHSSCLLVAGSHRGIVKCWAFSWNAEDLEKSKCYIFFFYKLKLFFNCEQSIGEIF